MGSPLRAEIDEPVSEFCEAQTFQSKSPPQVHTREPRDGNEYY